MLLKAKNKGFYATFKPREHRTPFKDECSNDNWKNPQIALYSLLYFRRYFTSICMYALLNVIFVMLNAIKS